MRYTWVFILIAVLGLIFFNRFLLSSKNSLASLITLEALEEPALIEKNGREVIAAKIYSTYPFNHRNRFFINAGASHGVEVGFPVTADGNILIGQVIEVFENKSSVRTIFDRDWSLSVRIGDGEIDALLASGQEPRLTMIDKKADLRAGDLVYSASRDFPYGLKIGMIENIWDASITTFQEAGLSTPYDLIHLRVIYVLL